MPERLIPTTRVARLATLCVLLFGLSAPSALAEPAGGAPGGARLSAGALDVGTAANACVVVGAGDLRCWGENGGGQVGNGTTTDANSPVAVTLSGPASSVSFGVRHACAVLGTGSVQCWGDGSVGQLGPASTGSNSPVAVSLPSGVTALTAGGLHTCAILVNGGVSCWGNNLVGQIGDGTTGATPVAPTPVSLGGRSAVAIAAGLAHTCAVLSTGELVCWGGGESGQLGNGTLVDAPTPVTVNLGAGRTAVAVAAGSGHTCAILDNGSVKCFGDGTEGQLGDGSFGDETTPLAQPSPVTAALPGAAVAIGAGTDHTCAVLATGALSCWGGNAEGQLGLGSTTQHAAPVAVSLPSGRTAVAISAGGAQTCTVLDDGGTRCWGDGRLGQLGNGSNTSYGATAGQTPATLPALTTGGSVSRIDRDGDGLLDSADACPTQAATTANGCPTTVPLVGPGAENPAAVPLTQKGRVLTINASLIPRPGVKRCPATVRVVATAGTQRASRVRDIVRATSATGALRCRLTGQVTFRATPKVGARIRVVVTSPKLKTRTLTVKAAS